MGRTIRNKVRTKKPETAGETIDLIAPTTPDSGWKRWLPLTAVVCLVFVFFYPSIDNGFVSWDDDHYLFDNHQVHYNEGIKSIWFDVFRYSHDKYRRPDKNPRVSHQYYPLVFTLYWIEFRFHQWFNGADPDKTIEQNISDGKMTAASFHVVSIVMHAFNCILLLWCFRALGLSNWVAWAAVLLFAIHPMQVATVAWAAERKNIISLMFYLLSLMSYIGLRRHGNWWRYVLSLLLFQAALFSKTVSLSLPIMLFFTDRLIERRWSWEMMKGSLVRILPYVALSCMAAWTTIHVEDRDRTIPLTESQRPLVPCTSLLFYPSKMLVPTDLSPVYRLWEPDPQKLIWYAPTLVAIALAALIIAFRKRLGSHFIWAVLLYCITMGPMLGFKNINYFQFAFVADHYFYHGAVGLFLLLAIGLDFLRRRITPEAKGTAIMTTVVGLAAIVYGVQTFTYCNVWQTPDTFWERTIEKNDTCWPAYFNTANARAKEAAAEKDPQKRYDLYEEAAKRYLKVADIHKKIVQPFDQLNRIRRIQKNWDNLLRESLEATRRFPRLSHHWESAVMAAVKLGRMDDAANILRSAGTFSESMGNRIAKSGNHCSAVKHYKKALKYYRRSLAAVPDNNASQQAAERVEKKMTNAQQTCSAGQ